VHGVGEAQDTPSSTLAGGTPTVGSVSVVQVTPFHACAYVCQKTSGAPTATQLVDVLHDTAARSSLAGVVGGVSDVCAFQLVPFNCSTIARPPAPPTAVHAVCEVQDTPVIVAASWLGLPCGVHVMPSNV
jgi:hypothetical protein